MRPPARVSIVQLLVGAFAAIAAPVAQATDGKLCAQPRAKPITIAARHDARLPGRGARDAQLRRHARHGHARPGHARHRHALHGHALHGHARHAHARHGHARPRIKPNTQTSAPCSVRVVRGKVVRRTLVLIVQTTMPGKITVGGKDLRTVSQRFSMAQTVTLEVPLSRAALKRLHRKRRAKIRVLVVFMSTQKAAPMMMVGPAAVELLCGKLSCTGARTPTLPLPPESSPSSTPEQPGEELLFSGNWETGNISQWSWGAQCGNYTSPPPGSGNIGNLSIVTDVVAQGMYSARFDLPADTAGNNSCEVLRKRTVALGTDDWYAQEVYFPSNWQEPSRWGLLLGQYDFQGITGPPVGLYAHANYVDLGIETGLCPPKQACQYGGTPDIVPLGTNLAGTWQQFIVRVYHAADSSGLVQGWWRPRGSGTWTHTVTWHGVTVQWTNTESPNTNTPNTNATTSDKIGAYRGPASFPISIWQDGFCVARSFAAAESCL